MPMLLGLDSVRIPAPPQGPADNSARDTHVLFGTSRVLHRYVNQTVLPDGASQLHVSGKILAISVWPEQTPGLRATLGSGATVVDAKSTYQLTPEVFQGATPHSLDFVVLFGHHWVDDRSPDFCMFNGTDTQFPITPNVEDAIASRLKPGGALVIVTCHGASSLKIFAVADGIAHPVIGTQTEAFSTMSTESGGQWWVAEPGN